MISEYRPHKIVWQLLVAGHIIKLKIPGLVNKQL